MEEDYEELERAFVTVDRRRKQLEETIARQSPADLQACFAETRNRLLARGGEVGALASDLVRHAVIAQGRRASVVGDNQDVWEDLALLEISLHRLRREGSDAELSRLGVR